MRSKIIAAAVGAFGAGALLGWAITSDIYENKLREERRLYDKYMRNKTQHIWALQDRLENQGLFKDIGTTSQTINLVYNEDLIEEEPEVDVVPDGETPEETRSNLQRLIDMYTAPSDEEIMEGVGVEPSSSGDRSTPPFVISKAQYAFDDEGDSYSKITLTYFPRDRVLLDDDDEPIEDIARMVGWRSLSQFGGESEDPDVVFVRNRRMETDFEIVKEEEAPLPLHVKYGMEKEEFRANKAAGLIKLRQEDE